MPKVIDLYSPRTPWGFFITTTAIDNTLTICISQENIAYLQLGIKRKKGLYIIRFCLISPKFLL